MPAALAYDAEGDLYIADAAAQRIRRLRKGLVETIAGSGQLGKSEFWVDGGYADGPGVRAKFYAPSGIAVARSGTIYVSDTYNHCIRAISRTGIVTTYAGSPTHPGNADGQRLQANFSRPLGLALDGSGALYVADADVGIRRIDTRTGAVITLRMLVFTPFSVLIAPGPRGERIIVADAEGLKITDSRDSVQFNILDQVANYKIYERPSDHEKTQGLVPLGNPFGLAIAGDMLAYSDLRSNTIRALDLQSHALTLLAGAATEDGANIGATVDGFGPAARLNAPMGIATGPGGILAIADAGGRRIRALRRRAFRIPFTPSDRGLFPPPSPKGAYTIAYLGNSFAWWDTDWETSIQGQLQARLQADALSRASSRMPQVIPIYFPGADIRALSEYLRELMEFRHIDAVVVQLNTFAIPHRRNLNIGPAASIELASSASGWSPRLRRILKDTRDDCTKAKVACLLVSHPFAWEIASNENLMYGVLNGNFVPQGAIEKPLQEAITESGLRFVNLWSVFRREERSREHQPLFGAYDPHFSLHGRAVVAHAVGDAFAAWAPWREPR